MESNWGTGGGSLGCPLQQFSGVCPIPHSLGPHPNACRPQPLTPIPVPIIPVRSSPSLCLWSPHNTTSLNRALAENGSRVSWDRIHHCRLLAGLVPDQVQICRRNLEVMHSIVQAASKTKSICQKTFSSMRWNCSSIQRAPSFGPDLLKGKEEKTCCHYTGVNRVPFDLQEMRHLPLSFQGPGNLPLSMRSPPPPSHTPLPKPVPQGHSRSAPAAPSPLSSLDRTSDGVAAGTTCTTASSSVLLLLTAP